MLGDPNVSIEEKKKWVWKEVQTAHPEIKPEYFSFDDPYMFHEILARNCYRYTPARGFNVMDIGANVGVFTALCALNGAVVTAFEPHPKAFPVLIDTMRRCGIEKLVTAWNCAIGSARGQHHYHPSVTPPNGTTQTWTSYNGAMNTPGSDPDETVYCVPIEEAVGDEKWDCVKMDIEGAEFEILLGMPDTTFKNVNFFTLELHNGWATKSVHDALVKKLRNMFADVSGVFDGDPRFKGEERFISLFCIRR